MPSLKDINGVDITKSGLSPLQTAPAPVTPAPISISSLTAPATPLAVPPTPAPSNPNPLIDTSLDSLLKAYNAPTPAEGNASDLQARILKSMDTLGGKSARQMELENNAGLPAQKAQLQDIVNQLQGLQKEAAAIPLQIQQDSAGRGVTAAGVAPIEAGRVRENAIKALGLSAIGQTLQGNISLAETSISRAVDLEFEPEEQKLATLKQLYDFNKDDLERQDKKRADTLNAYLDERTRVLAEQKADKQEIYNIGLTAQKYGADPATVQKIFSSGNREDAVAQAGQFLTDPAAKYELESARLDNMLKRAQIDQTQKQTSLLGEPTEKEKKETEDAIRSAKADIPVLQDKITAVDVIKGLPGMAASVGPNVFARSAPDFNFFTGVRQDFAGAVHKLVGGLTLDNLIAAKARGATFGALSEGELNILANSATALNDWEIKDKNGKSTGQWDIDEASFNRELDTIKTLTQRALTQSQGSVFSSDEKSVLDSIGTDKSIIDPASYFK